MVQPNIYILAFTILIRFCLGKFIKYLMNRENVWTWGSFIWCQNLYCWPKANYVLLSLPTTHAFPVYGWSAGWEETKVHSALRDPACPGEGWSSCSGKNLEINDAYEINSSKTLVELDFKHEKYWYWKFANMNEAPADENG